MTKHEVYRAVLRGSIQGTTPLEDILVVGLVLHTHSLVLPEGLELDGLRRDPRTRSITLAPLTWTYVAQLLSSLWPSGNERSRSDHWLAHCQRMVPYEALEDVPHELRARVAAAKHRVLAHALIERLLEE